MAVSYSRNVISSGYNLTLINENFENIATALEDAVSRSGTSPNQMNSDFDMNSFDILNAESVSTHRLIIDGEEVGTSAAPMVILTEMIEARDATIAAAEEAEALVNSGYVPIYDTVVGMSDILVPSVVNAVRVNGYTTVGDGGSAKYVKVASEPTHAGKFSTIGPVWWEISEEDKTPEMFGALGTGLTSDVTAFQNALDSFGTVGGTLWASGIYLIDSDLTIPANVTLRLTPAKVGLGQVGSQLFKQGGRLLISSAATVKLRAGSEIVGGTAVRASMTGPEVNAASFAGTAITADGNYCRVAGMLIVGFSRAFTSTGFNGVVFEDNRFDCLNGPRAINDPDRPVFRNNWGHPYGTIEASGRIETFDTTNWAYRSGYGYEFQGCAWPNSSGNWCYGYNISARYLDCSNPTCSEASFEGHFTNVSPFVLSAAGILVEGTTTGGKFSDVNSVHFINPIIQQNGATDAFNVYSSIHVRDFSGNGVAFVTGGGLVDDFHIKGGSANGPGTGGNGIRVISATNPVFIGDGLVDGVGVGIRIASNNGIFSGKSAVTNSATKFNMEAPRRDVASAATISIPEYVTDVRVTGTASISNITATRAGHMVRLLFADSASMVNTGNIRLSGGTTFTATTGHVVQLYCENVTGSTVWREISRSLSS